MNCINEDMKSFSLSSKGCSGEELMEIGSQRGNWLIEFYEKNGG